MIKRTRLIAAACSLVGVCSLVGQATARSDVVLARKSATGARAQALTSADIGHYRKVYVFVTARPKQRVSGSWTLSCHLGGSGSSRDAGDFKGKTPLGVAVRTYTLMPSEKCVVIGTSTLARKGRITVELVAH